MGQELRQGRNRGCGAVVVHFTVLPGHWRIPAV
jgi:hypothetical protein